MPHLSSLTEYKRTVINTFLRDKEFVELVANDKNHVLPASDLFEKQCFLYDYVDSTVKDDKVYVCVEVDPEQVVNCAVTRFNLYVYVAVPKSLMSMDGQIRRDAICQRIDELLNGRTDFGFGRLERKPSPRMQFSESFRGRVLVYTVEDWNRHCKTLA